MEAGSQRESHFGILRFIASILEYLKLWLWLVLFSTVTWKWEIQTGFWDHATFIRIIKNELMLHATYIEYSAIQIK